MDEGLWERLESLCLSYPGVTEKLSHGSLSFFVGRQFAAFWPQGHHDVSSPHLWCAAAPGAQAGLIASAPTRIFRPPYVGARGWIGVMLDGEVDEDYVALLLDDAYRAVAGPKYLRALDEKTRPPL